MTKTSRKVALNRPVFTQRAFDSRALTVLTTLVHRFSDPGQHDVLVRRDGRVIDRFSVDVASENAEHQINIDMSTLGGEERGCGCDAGGGYSLIAGGVIGFYASAGTGGYSVRVSRLDNEKEKKLTLLESSRSIAAGDLFAITLVRPGVYRVIESKRKNEAQIRVTLPKRTKKGFRTDQPTLVTIGKDGAYDRKLVEIFSGQSVVFQCEAPTRIRADLAKEDESIKEPTGGSAFRIRRPRRGDETK